MNSIMPVSCWSSFKALVLAKDLRPQYVENSKAYDITAVEDTYIWSIGLVKDGGTDVTDFETTHKAKYNKPLGPKPFADPSGYFARFHGMSGTATAGQSTNIDYKLTADRYINGIRLILKDQVFGDSVKLQVVDIDNVLGYGTNVVLNEFGTSWFVADDTQQQEDVIVQYPAKIYANLYIRIVYTSTGQNNVSLCANLFLHEKT